MIEIPVALFTLLSEALFIAVVVLLVWMVVTIKRNKRDRQAVAKLIEQVKHQSQTRLETTGSFLSEKYRFEGDELKKGVKSIDRAEKRFMQKFIQVYLKRDAEALTGMDASMAEMIDAYKSLTPAIPDTQPEEDVPEGEMQQLREANDKLQEELAITKETMANMISEFGNMFGGGSDHELDKEEVVEKVVERGSQTVESDDIAVAEVAAESEIDVADGAVDSELDQELDPAADDIVLDESSAGSQDTEDDTVLADEGVDELLDSIDLSDGK